MNERLVIEQFEDYWRVIRPNGGIIAKIYFNGDRLLCQAIERMAPWEMSEIDEWVNQHESAIVSERSE